MHKEIIIIIPHYNNPKGLYKSVASIKEEIKMDIVIIDDGSQQEINIANLRKEYKLGRIYYKKQQTNKGIAQALNVGIDFARKNEYKYIARLDAGDFCCANKYNKQYRYLEKHSDIKLLGTWVRVVDSKGAELFNLKHPVGYKQIKRAMCLNSAFVHPSVMFSSEILKVIKGYPLNYFAAEDYAFFFDVINKFKAENYPEILMDYSVDKNSISSKHRKQQVKNRIKIMIKNFYFGFYPIYGILRSLILLLFSRQATNFIKTKIS